MHTSPTMASWKTAPPLSYKISLKLFVRSLYGSSGSINIFSLGLSYASATSWSAISNLLPVVTFFLAVLLRMESLNVKKFHGIRKLSGVIFCIAGVIVLSFYQGPELKSFNHHHFFHHVSNFRAGGTAHSTMTWILGIFLMTLGIVCWALWTVLQGPMLDAYPSKLLNTTLQMIFATIQCFFIALVVERDFSRWELGLNIGLVAVHYSVCSICLSVVSANVLLCLATGVLISGIAYYMQVWVIDKSGPVFLSMTTPINPLITVILCSLLGEPVNLGSILGGIIMVGVLYCVLWAKGAEQVDVSKQHASPVQMTQV